MAVYRLLDMLDMEHSTDLFGLLDGVVEVEHRKPDSQLLYQIIGDYHAVLSSLKVRFDRSIIDRAEKCKAIFTVSTGTDHIDVDYAEAKGIHIISIKNDYEFLKTITATAELAWALLLGVIRRIPWAFDAAKNGIWARDLFIGHSLEGKTLGILGYGRLGEIIGRYGAAFGMKVIACDVKDIGGEDVKQVSYDELLSKSDILTVHVHLNEKTKHLINIESFNRMKDEIVIINTSRGGIIDEQAFLGALLNGKVSAAGIDVIDGEWDTEIISHPLIKYARAHDNLLISPHIGGVTYESQRRALEHTLYKIKDYFTNL